MSAKMLNIHPYFIRIEDSCVGPVDVLAYVQTLLGTYTYSFFFVVSSFSRV